MNKSTIWYILKEKECTGELNNIKRKTMEENLNGFLQSSFLVKEKRLHNMEKM